MAYHDWHVGMKVVCVNAGAMVQGTAQPNGLVEGRVYTIRWIGPYTYGCGEYPSLRLNEYVRDACDSPVGAARFRRVQKRKTDISIFTAMLNPQKHEVDA